MSKKDTAREYTDEEVQEYIDTVCPINLLGADKELIRKHMEAEGWKPAVKEGPVKEKKTDAIARVIEPTTWKLLNKKTGKIACNICGAFALLTARGKLPKICHHCRRPTISAPTIP